MHVMIRVEMACGHHVEFADVIEQKYPLAECPHCGQLLTGPYPWKITTQVVAVAS